MEAVEGTVVHVWTQCRGTASPLLSHVESTEPPGPWRSKGIDLFWCLIFQLWDIAGDSTLDKVVLFFRWKPGGRPMVPVDKDLIEQMLNSPGDEPKYLLGEDTLPACLNWRELRVSTIWRQITDFFLLPTNRLVRPGDIQVTKTSLQQRGGIPVFNCYDIPYTSKYTKKYTHI